VQYVELAQGWTCAVCGTGSRMDMCSMCNHKILASIYL